eukprot:scaffold11564_cov180-Ochromonas_danica.AAC.3
MLRIGDPSSQALAHVNLMLLTEKGIDKELFISCLVGAPTLLNLKEKENEVIPIQGDQGEVKIFNIEALTGDLKRDYHTLHQVVKKAPKDGQVDLVFLCLSSVTVLRNGGGGATKANDANATTTSSDLSKEEDPILQLIRTCTTPQFQDLIRVVIMHTPEDRIDENYRQLVVNQFSFLTESREELLNRIVFMDLINPKAFGNDLQGSLLDAIHLNWTKCQKKLYPFLLTTKDEKEKKKTTAVMTIPVVKYSEILSENVFRQVYLVRKRDIWTTVGCTILGLLLLLCFSLNNSYHRELTNRKLLQSQFEQTIQVYSVVEFPIEKAITLSDNDNDVEEEEKKTLVYQEKKKQRERKPHKILEDIGKVWSNTKNGVNKFVQDQREKHILEGTKKFWHDTKAGLTKFINEKKREIMQHHAVDKEAQVSSVNAV